MSPKHLASSVLALASSVVVSIALAKSQYFTVASTTVTKESMFQLLSSTLPGSLCGKFIQDARVKARMDALNITYEQCVSTMPFFVIKCRDEYYDSIPNVLDYDNAISWSYTIGHCAGKSYAEKYL